ncbi:ABC transporter ATP-binding protein [Romboutsia weinsteinii]|uniref:ABC transporter ATP-binding protein n=1 Tax=Romboutsia weinsteinii TaxID=2020949 RepID=A0A371IYS1_9FIRM|nr:ABC transporter ATP-binding protein [Romboutsia weinsteinii]RDY25618.1 ABC transporter ATP-binding protein [Romboutsia weinsteinii]
MLNIKNLKKKYSSKGGEYIALNNVSLDVKKGEFVSVMGPSGSGKTTLLNCISGFIKGDAGEILLDNQNILNLKEEDLANVRQNKLGFVFQDFMLINGLTVLENVYLPQIIANRTIEEMEKRTNKLLTSFRISDIQSKYPTEISGGQKQRTAVARALSNKPLVLLADEPTGNLDSKSSISVIEAFIDAKTNLDATIFMVTHDAFAASYSDRVIALKDGEIVRELARKGTPREFSNEILVFMNSINGVAYEA